MWCTGRQRSLASTSRTDGRTSTSRSRAWRFSAWSQVLVAVAVTEREGMVAVRAAPAPPTPTSPSASRPSLRRCGLRLTPMRMDGRGALTGTGAACAERAPLAASHTFELGKGMPSVGSGGGWVYLGDCSSRILKHIYRHLHVTYLHAPRSPCSAVFVLLTLPPSGRRWPASCASASTPSRAR